MESGVVELREERLEFTFENKNGVVEIAVYPILRPDLPAAITFDYDPVTMSVSNKKFARTLSESRQGLLNLVMAQDRTDQKEAIKYRALMAFMTYYRDIVQVESREVKRSSHPPKSKKHSRRRIIPLVRKSYTIEDFDKAALPKPDGIKRRYTKPEHEVNVRGYLRRYKSGRVVWINPTVRYKGKETRHKEYEL